MYSHTYLAGSVQYKFFYYQQLLLLLLLVAISKANRRRSWRNTTVINYQIESFKMRSWTGGNDYLIVHVTCSYYGVYENKHVHYWLAFLDSFVNIYLHLDTFLVFINKHFFWFAYLHKILLKHEGHYRERIIALWP